MPINRVPIIHKFGIISQSQRDELEKRIAQKALSETQHKTVSQQALSRPLPFEVTEDFVYKFNDSSQEERNKLEDTAFKMLKRLRRLSGLRDAGEVHHADPPRAWVDLALLAQCQSHKLEDACLETIIASLDQAPVSEDHVLSLFYLAKSGIHWLKRDSFNQAVLRSSEIKLLKMTRLVFFRLYCHCLLGQLQEYEGQQTSLAQYLKGFSAKINSYNQFPGAELSIRFIVEAGCAICDSSKRINSQDHSSTEQPCTSENTLHEVHWVDRQDTASISTSHFVKNNTAGHSSSKFTFLWHCINIWYVANNEKFRVNDALYDLFQTLSHLAIEPWLDIVFAFYILADACRHNARVLNAFQYLISLDFSTVPLPLDVVPLCDTCYSGFSNTRDKKMRYSMLTAEYSPTCNTVSECQGSNSPNVLEKLKTFVDCGIQGNTVIQLGLEGETKQRTIPTCQGSTSREHTRSPEDDESSGTFNDINAVLETCRNIEYYTCDVHDAESLGNAETTGAAHDAKEYKDMGCVNEIVKSGEKGGCRRKTCGMVDKCETSRTKDLNEYEFPRKLSGEQLEAEKKAARLASVEIIDENSESSRIDGRISDFLAIPTAKQQNIQKRCTNSTLMDTIVENGKSSHKHEDKNNLSVETAVEGDENNRNSSRRNYLFIGQTSSEQYDTEKRCLDSFLVETIVENHEKSQITKSKQNLPNASNSSATETPKPSHRWPWELVYTFCECMTSICLHGMSSNVQKAALLGDGNEGSIAGRYGNSMGSRYGLINFLENGKDDWRIRYAAVQGLVLVGRHYYDDVTKGGLANAAWSSLMSCQAKERDGRVLDAIKVGKVEADLQNNLVKDRIPVSLWTSRIAAVLSQTFLPQAIPAKLSLTTPTPSVTTVGCSVNKFKEKSAKAKRTSSCTKPSLRQEISLSNACRAPRMSYGERMSLELRSVVEDQWKKRLLEEMEEELKTNVVELEKQKKEELLKSKMDALTMP